MSSELMQSRLGLLIKPILWMIAFVSFLTLILILRYYQPDIHVLRDWIVLIKDWRADKILDLAVGFFVLYTISVALSLPFSIWMTLIAGALFGFWFGVLLVSFASSIGATLAFLFARYFLRDQVKTLVGERAKILESGIANDGAFYLFTLRLIPVIPFFVVNLLMGLTSIRLGTFYMVSQLGMLAATMVYVNAGTQIAGLESLSGIISPMLLVSFALLGIFPWIARVAIAFIKRRRVYARWSKPPRFDRNLIVIGGGAAGLVSSYISAATKAKVTLVERHKMGGDCLNYGCIPSKTLIKSATIAHQINNAEHYGFESGQLKPSFIKVMERIHQVISHIAPHDSQERYQSLGVEVLSGHARFKDPWTIEIQQDDGSSREITSRSTIIATGAAPVIPPLPGLDIVGYMTSETLWSELRHRSSPPNRLVILGGGAIGSELAQAFARLGSQVTQIERAPRIMFREDEEVSVLLQAALVKDGIRVMTESQALCCGINDGVKWIEIEHKSEKTFISFDDIIIAVGRSPRLENLGLEKLGISMNHIFETNEYLETIYPNILAAGDVVGRYKFTHVAGHQAWFATVNALFGNVKRFKPDYRVIPWAIFTDPEIARVGLSEFEANEKGILFEVTRYRFGDLDRALVDGITEGFVKVLTVPGKDRILGVTIVAAHAADLIAEFVLAMKSGLGLNKILETIHIYPTLVEINKSVAGKWRSAHINETFLEFSKRFNGWNRG